MGRHPPLEAEMLPVWLDDAGVTCGLVGKYFVGLARQARPGWSFWRSPFAEGKADNRGYTVAREDGSTSTPDMQQAHYFTEQCVDFVTSAQAEPWFLWYCPNDPHTPLQGTAERRDDYVDFDWREPRTRVAGKPRWVRDLPDPSAADIRTMRAQQRSRLRELADLDASVEAIWDAVIASGQQDRTVMIFTSDNGNALLDHRLPPLGKNAPYDVCMRVPLVVVGPGFTPGRSITTPVAAAQDLTACVLDLYGIQAPIPQDGRSLREIADNGRDDRSLLGHCDLKNGPPGMPPNDIAVTESWKLVRYRDQSPENTYELYDLERDPHELTNLANGSSSHRQQVDQLDGVLDGLLTAD